MKKTLVVLSGGQDSTVCTYWAKRHNDEVHAITFDYNQRHSREIDAAMHIAELAQLQSHKIVSLGGVLEGKSPLTNPSERLEQYDNAEEMGKTIGSRRELTFVPMRNALFLTIAANRAEVLGIDVIITGVCQMDGSNYDDCRPEFIGASEKYINYALGHDHRGTKEIRIVTPLMNKSKAETVELALELPGCWEALAYSHTAYDGSFPPLGKDHATVLRADGFEKAGYPDPLIVRAWHEGSMELPTTRNYAHIRKQYSKPGSGPHLLPGDHLSEALLIARTISKDGPG